MYEEKIFYVYRYRVIDTKEVFYIGKGTGKRYKTITNRSKKFLEMYESNNCEVQILWNYLTEEEAFKLERMLIAYYRLCTHHNLVNQLDGGEGLYGTNNPNYGNKWSDDMKQKASKRVRESGNYKGDKNPNSKAVRCIETGEIFSTMSAAAKHYRLKYPSSIWHAMEKPTRVAAGLHWEFYSK